MCVIIIYLLNYNYKMIYWQHCSIYNQIHTVHNNLCKFLYSFLNFQKLKNVLLTLISVHLEFGRQRHLYDWSSISLFLLKRNFERSLKIEYGHATIFINNFNIQKSHRFRTHNFYFYGLYIMKLLY